MEKSKKNVVIIDGYGFIFRAFFSLADFKTRAGLPTGAVYGFINMILKVINNFEPSYLILVFDSGKKSFRSELFTDYKAHRKEVPEDLKPQFKIVREAADALNIKYVEVEGFEADDIIATYAKLCSEANYKSIIISSDKDLMQLAKDDVTEFYDPMKGKFLKEADVSEKFGVKPTQIMDYLAIVGDASDNIPGVKGVGEKGASEILSQFANLEEIYENLDKISKSRIKNALESGKEMAFLSKQLARLECCVEVPNFKEFEVKAFEKDVLFDFLEKYEFNALIAKLTPSYNKKQADLFSFSNEVKSDISIKTPSDLENFLNSVKDPEILLKVRGSDLILETKTESVKVENWWAE